MGRPLYATLSFFAHLLRDLGGTLRERWRRFDARVVHGRETAAVGVDIYPFFEQMTGVGWYEWNLLAALDERDDGLSFNLYAHTFLAPDEAAPPPMPGARNLRLRLHHLPPDFLLPIGPTLRLLRHVIEPLLRVLDGNDVLFAPNFFAPRSQLPYGATTVATVHDLAFAAMPETVGPETLANLREQLPVSLYRAERLMAVSDATARDLQDHLGVNPRRVHTVHEGLDPRFAEGARDAAAELALPERYLLFVSTLEPRKNVVGVLRAFAVLLEWGYPGHLVLAGRWGWHVEPIRRELASPALSGRVVHLDYVRREHLPGLYRGAEALLFPSWMEGFGLPLLEAMACGTPVVTSGRSSMPEVAGGAAVYVDPDRPHGIASAVAALLADDEHRRDLARAGRTRAARFSWPRAAAATAAVLRQAAGLPDRGDDEYRV